MNWEFWIGDVVIPIGIFVAGFFAGKTVERRSTAKVNGNGNTVIQNSKTGNK